MKKLIPLIILLVFGCTFNSCATTDQNKKIDLKKLVYGGTSIEEITALFDNDSKYKLQFRLNEKNFYFLQYRVPGTDETASFLFEGDKLVAVDKSKGRHYFFGFENCIVFPLSEEDNIYECLFETTDKFISSRYPLQTLTFEHADIDKLEPWMYAVELATYSALTCGAPIVLGAAFAPFFAIDDKECSETHDELAAVFRLGEPMEKYENIFQELPDYAVSKNARSTSLLILAGVFSKVPIYSIGIHDGKIIWIAEPPSGTCYKRNFKKACRLGNQDRLYWPK